MAATVDVVAHYTLVHIIRVPLESRLFEVLVDKRLFAIFPERQKPWHEPPIRGRTQRLKHGKGAVAKGLALRPEVSRIVV